MRGSRLLLFFITVLLLLSCSRFVFSAPQQQSATKKQEAEATGQRFITIDFDNVDIRLFIKYISELTGKNFVVDKAVQGSVTIVSPTKISDGEAYRVFESVLEVHGFTTVPSGSIIKIIPSATARSKNVEMVRMGITSHPEDKVVTQLIPLLHTSPADMKKVLAPLVSKSSVVIGHTQSGMLIITETLSNIQRLLAIIEVLDVEYSEEDVAVIPLENSAATAIAKILNTIYQKSGGGAKGAVVKAPVRVVPYERVNSLVVMASSDEIARVEGLVGLLDTKGRRGEGNIHVFYLQNANSMELAKVLNSLAGTPVAEAEKGKAAVISKNVKVMADEETNALIITASKEEYEVLKVVIEKLDIPRQMVYLEALIMEVNTRKDFEVGVEWIAGGVSSDGTGQLVTGFSGDGYSGLQGISGDEKTLSNGFSLGVLKQGIQIGGITFPNIAAILKAYESDSDINIIATPQILTTDNKKAEISVGENVPYITSKNTTDALQNYSQYEYRDVATKLAITPQINQADTMRLEIETEVVKVKEGTTDNDTPTTYRRTASTTVILNDRDTVVIGGIIGQDATSGEYKIPLLGDIPLLGWLFKTESTSNVKTNMFIFVTPRIIRNPADIARVTLEKEDQLDDVLPAVKYELHKPVNKEHATRLAERGYLKLQKGLMKEAKQYFQEALENDPNNPYALLNMGVVAEYDGFPEKAIEFYQKAIENDIILVENNAETETETETDENIDQESSLSEIAQENILRIQSNAILD